MSTLSRRDFVRSSAALLAGGVLLGLPRRSAAARRDDTTYFQWLEPAPGFFVAVMPESDKPQLLTGNCTLVVKGGSALLIDTSIPVLGLTLRREGEGHAKVEAAINTHHHMDHTGGNFAWTKDTPLHANPNCRQRVIAQTDSYAAQLDQKIAALKSLDLPGAKDAYKDAASFKSRLKALKQEAWAPTKLIEGDPEMRIAGRKLRCIHAGPGHTDNDVFVHFAEENVIVAGDLLFNGVHPYFDTKNSGASSAGWVRSLKRLEELCDKKTVVVPGHGMIGNAQSVRAQIKYFEEAVSATEKAIKSGKTRDEVAAMHSETHKSYKFPERESILYGNLYDEQIAARGK